MRRSAKRSLIVFGCCVGLSGAVLFAQTQPPPPKPVPAFSQPGGQPVPGGPGSADDGTQDSVEPLTRGPVHEGFAEMTEMTPQPIPPVAGQPPEPIDEQPADARPDNPEAEWLPGYWNWDADRNGYVWVSGVWRIPPPGNRWVPGYWTAADAGAQRVPGFWQPGEVEQVDYLPAPPAYESEGVEPASAPSPDVFWIPGFWSFVNRRYAWQGGYWARTVPGWMWVAAHYVWTPSGYVFVEGHWDFPLENRGMLFAPIAFGRPVYRQAGFVYRPASVIDLTMLADNLFVYPAFQQYCFGDYYAASYQKIGIYPWFSIGTGPYLYDPIFAYRSWYDRRRNPRWREDLRLRYDRLVRNPALRPPRTWRDEMRIAHAGNRPPGYRPMVMPLKEAVREGGGRYVAVTQAERRDYARNLEVRRRLAVDRSQLERRTPPARPGEKVEPRPPQRPLRLPTSRPVRPAVEERERPPAERDRVPKGPSVQPIERPRTEPRPAPRPEVKDRGVERGPVGRVPRAEQPRPMPPPKRPERFVQPRPAPEVKRPAGQPVRPERKP